MYLNNVRDQPLLQSITNITVITISLKMSCYIHFINPELFSSIIYL